MKHQAAFRTDKHTTQGLQLVQFTAYGEQLDMGGGHGGSADMTIEITLDPEGAAPGALVVLKAASAELLGLERKPTIVRAVACPAGTEERGMFDGAFLTSSDSRWPFCSPVPIHDRFE